MSATTLLIGFGLLSALVLVHELGHYWMARRMGLEVPAFSIGFGPRLFGFRMGETEYTWRLLPLGGFVALPALDPDSDASIRARFWTLLAGPLANALVAALLMGPGTAMMAGWLWVETILSLATGPASGVELSGVVGISQAAGHAVAAGWQTLSLFAGFLSLNLALFNLLPFPGLDGGRLVGLLIERLSGGRPRWEPAVQGIGLLLLLGFGLWVTGRELLRFIW